MYFSHPLLQTYIVCLQTLTEQNVLQVERASLENDYAGKVHNGEYI